MAKIKLRSKFDTILDEKCNDAYNESSATHHLFHSKSSFINYEKIEPESVKLASSTSKLVDKGTIKLPFDNVIIIEAYHAPEFSAKTYRFVFYSRHTK